MNINYNGALIGAEGNILALHNRAFAYGDAVTDVSKYSYQQLLFWEEHYLRLMAGMRVLRMNIPMSFSMEYIEEEILKTIRSNALESQPVRVRISIFRKSGNTYTPTNNDIEYLIETQPLSSAFYVLNEEPYEVELFKDFYIQPDLLANIKHTNRIVNILGSIFRPRKRLSELHTAQHPKEHCRGAGRQYFFSKWQHAKDACPNRWCCEWYHPQDADKIATKNRRLSGGGDFYFAF